MEGREKHASFFPLLSLLGLVCAEAMSGSLLCPGDMCLAVSLRMLLCLLPLHRPFWTVPLPLGPMEHMPGLWPVDPGSCVTERQARPHGWHSGASGAQTAGTDSREKPEAGLQMEAS